MACLIGIYPTWNKVVKIIIKVQQVAYLIGIYPMSNKDEITVGCKVKKEVAEELKAEAAESGIGVNTLLRKIIANRHADDVLREISFLYDIDTEKLLKNIQWMLGVKKIFIKDGKLKWNPKAMNPEYISLDDKIDLMPISDREKDRIKRTLAQNAEKMVRLDDTGNGGGL